MQIVFYKNLIIQSVTFNIFTWATSPLHASTLTPPPPPPSPLLGFSDRAPVTVSTPGRRESLSKSSVGTNSTRSDIQRTDSKLTILDDWTLFSRAEIGSVRNDRRVERI